MKLEKNSKIFALVLCLVLLVSSAFAVMAGAADENTVEILAQNIVYGDKVSIAYAVKADVSDAISGNVSVSYYWSDETAEDAKKAVLLDTTVETNLYEGKYPVFVTEGVPAKELDKVAYAAVTVGETVGEFDHTYSAVQYLYTRLYKEGFAAKTEEDGLDFERKALYENLLAYGASAQSVLINGKAETDEDKVTLITNYTYAYTLTDGVTLNGATALISEDAIEITAAYEGDRDLVGWILTDKNGGTTEYETATFTVEGVALVEPKYGVHTCIDENSDHICDTCLETVSECANANAEVDHNCDVCGKKIALCSDANADAICDVCNLYGYDYDVTTGVSLYTFTSTGNANPANQTSITESSTSTGYYGVLGSIATDPADATNKALKLVINGGVNNSNTSGLSKYFPSIAINPNEKAEGGNIHILEYDFYTERFNKAGVRNFMTLYAYDTDGNKGMLQNGGADGSTNGHTKSITAVTGTEVVENCFQVGVGSTQTENANYALFNSHTWYRFRFVYDATNGTIDTSVSFDGGKNWYLAAKQATTTSLTTAGVDTTKIDHLAISFTHYGHGEIFYLDNVSYKVATTAPTAPAESGIDSVEALYR